MNINNYSRNYKFCKFITNKLMLFLIIIFLIIQSFHSFKLNKPQYNNQIRVLKHNRFSKCRYNRNIIHSNHLNNIKQSQCRLCGSLDDNWSEYAANAITLIEEAALPTNGNELLAIFISESFAGFISGLLSRLIAFAIGDKKRDASIIKGTATGAYFGVRGVVRGISEILGLPRPVATVLAGFIGSVLSEEVKIVGRLNANAKFERDKLSRFEEDTIFLDESIEENYANETKSKDSVISLPELSQDITKWIAYDLFLPPGNGDVSPFTACVCGLASGIIAHTLYEILLPSTKVLFSNNSTINSSDYLSFANKFLRAGLEGGVLFASYESSITFFNSVVPEQISKYLSIDFSEIFQDLISAV